MYNRFFKNNFKQSLYVTSILGLNLVTSLAQTNSTHPESVGNNHQLVLPLVLPFIFMLIGAGLVYKCCSGSSSERIIEPELKGYQIN